MDSTTYMYKRMCPLDYEVHAFTDSNSRVFAMRSPVNDGLFFRETQIYKITSSTKNPSPFVQRVIIESFMDHGEPCITLDNHPTSLVNPEVYSALCLRQNWQSESTIQALRILAAEIYLGLSFIHRLGIVHQDVKPENLVVSRDGHIVLSNFGTARILPVVERQDVCSPSKVKRMFGKIKALDTTINLTPIYAAPELMETRHDASLEYDERVDWWSLGVTLYAISTGRFFFENEDDLPPYIEELLEDQIDHVQQTDSRFWDFMGRLLIRDRELRMCGKQVKLHPFFDPLTGLWGNIESLRYTPPCPHLPKVTHFYPVKHAPSSDDFELPNSQGYGNVIIYHASPNTESWPDNSEIHNAVMPSHLSSTRCLRRPVESGLNFSSDPDHLPCGNNFDTKYTNSPDYSAPNAINKSCNSALPCLSIEPTVRLRYNDGTTRLPRPNSGDLEIETYSRDGSGNDTEGDFNDSGLHLPLGDFPQSLSPSKDTDWKMQKHLERDAYPTESKALEIKYPTQPEHYTDELGATWSFEEQLAISLLSAGVTTPNNHGSTSAQVPRQRFTTMQLFVVTSRKVVKAVRKKFSQIFLR